MSYGKEKARQSWNLRRAQNVVLTTERIVHDKQLECTYRALAWMFVLAFGPMVFLGVM